MRRPPPIISESADELKRQMRAESHEIKKQRLHLLYLLASGQARERLEAAAMLGLHRNTVGRWLQLYEEGGLSTLLEIKPRPGAKPQLSPEQQQIVRDELAKPEGFSSYIELQEWIFQRFGIQMNYAALYHMARYRMGAKLKVPRPTNPKKKVEEIVAFREELADKIDALLPTEAPAAQLPPELWTMDESLFGLHTIQRRRLTLRGVKPVGELQIERQYFYLYGMVAPRTGEGYFQARRSMKKEEFASFISDFAADHPDRLHIIMVDNASSHHAKALELPDNVVLLFLPAYAPELSPIERVWLAIKNHLAWRNFATIAELNDHLEVLVTAFDDEQLRSLTAFPFIITAIEALAPAA